MHQYNVTFYNASGLVVVRHGPFYSFKSAQEFANGLLCEREYRGHNAVITKEA